MSHRVAKRKEHGGGKKGGLRPGTRKQLIVDIPSDTVGWGGWLGREGGSGVGEPVVKIKFSIAV